MPAEAFGLEAAEPALAPLAPPAPGCGFDRKEHRFELPLDRRGAQLYDFDAEIPRRQIVEGAALWVYGGSGGC